MNETKDALNQIKMYLKEFYMSEYEYSEEVADEDLAELTLESTNYQFAYTDLEASEINVKLNLKELLIQKELMVDILQDGKAELIVREYVHFSSYDELVEYMEWIDFDNAVSFDKVDAYELAGA